MLYDAVMVPFDGSDSACAALDEAVRFAKEDAGLALHVVQIVDLERTAVAKLEARGVDLTESVVPMGMQEAMEEATEYDDAKNEQGMLEARIAEITRILGEATVVATPKRSNSVHIGSTVTVDMGGRERVFTIVGAAEADSHAGKISNESPVGAALLAHKKGDEIETTGPTGRVIKMKIVNIEH